MNIVFDSGLELDDLCRTALEPLLPTGSSPLCLDASTGRTDGTLKRGEGIVFVTRLPIDVMSYHSDFFRNNCDAPQWFIILLNKSGQGQYDLIAAAKKQGLKNCRVLHAPDVSSLDLIAREIASVRQVTPGKTLLLCKRELGWADELARLLSDGNGSYEVGLYQHLKAELSPSESQADAYGDAEHFLILGERVHDFRGIELPVGCEPLFVADPKTVYDNETLISSLSKYFKLTNERVRSRLYFIDTKAALWSVSGMPEGDSAAVLGILLCDRFGLPRSRTEYTRENITAAAESALESLSRLKVILR